MVDEVGQRTKPGRRDRQEVDIRHAVYSSGTASLCGAISAATSPRNAAQSNALQSQIVSTAFTRSLHALGADRFRLSATTLGLATLILGGWGAWGAMARVSLYEVTDKARLEVDRAIYPVEAPIAGEVTDVWLTMGREVKPGDALFEIEADSAQLQLQEERARLGTVSPEIRALFDQVEAEQNALNDEQKQYDATIEEARAEMRVAESPAQYASEDEKRLKSLFKQGLIAEREYSKGRFDAKQKATTVERLRLAVGRLDTERRTKASERRTRIEKLRADVTHLQGQMSTSKKAIERLAYEVTRRTIRATVAGRLGEVAPLRTGAYVTAGQRLGAIVPQGRLAIVAEFPPAAALGRIHSGQPAQLRLQGYPWAQYGSIAAKVASVASEIRNGTVRVELEVSYAPHTVIPMQHGLPGAVEVEVEKITPFALVLRNAGKLLTEPRSAFAEPAAIQ